MAAITQTTKEALYTVCYTTVYQFPRNLVVSKYETPPTQNINDIIITKFNKSLVIQKPVASS